MTNFTIEPGSEKVTKKSKIKKDYSDDRGGFPSKVK